MSELLHCHAESFIFSMTDISLDKLSVHRRYGDIKGLSWFSESGEDFTISGHSASLSWLKFFKRPCMFAFGPHVENT